MATDSIFPGVLGHAKAQESLQRAIERGALHHGLIFVGPRGIGRATLARGLAKALHCKEAPSSGCGQCTICHRIDHDTHAGVEWVRPEGSGGKIKVAAARSLAARLESAPFEGDHHVVIFDPAEALGDATYNALLKTIEEPRAGVHFVMVATSLDTLLPTILSRCLTVRLGRLDDSSVATIVRQALAEQQAAQTSKKDPPPPPSEERMELAVRLAEGSAGQAVELSLDPSLDAAVALLAELAAAADAGPAKIFGGDKSSLWQAWAEAVGPGTSGKPARERAAAGRVTELWLLHLRERLRHREGIPGVTPGSDETSHVLRRLDRLQAFIDGLGRNPNVRLSLEQTLLEL